MMTFKQFLNEDVLDDLQLELFFRHVVGLPDADVDAAIKMMKYTGDPRVYRLSVYRVGGPLPVLDTMARWVAKKNRVSNIYDLQKSDERVVDTVRRYVKKYVSEV